MVPSLPGGGSGEADPDVSVTAAGRAGHSTAVHRSVRLLAVALLVLAGSLLLTAPTGAAHARSRWRSSPRRPSVPFARAARPDRHRRRTPSPGARSTSTPSPPARGRRSAPRSTGDGARAKVDRPGDPHRDVLRRGGRSANGRERVGVGGRGRRCPRWSSRRCGSIGPVYHFSANGQAGRRRHPRRAPAAGRQEVEDGREGPDRATASLIFTRRSRRTQPRSGGCSSEAPAKYGASTSKVRTRQRLLAAHSSLTTTSSWTAPFAPSAHLDVPAEVAQRLGQARRGARVRAVLEQRAEDPALGRLVEVADHLAPARRPRGAPGRWRRAAQAGRPPERGVHPAAQVDEESVADELGDLRAEGLAPDPGHGAERRAGRRRRRGGTPGSGRSARPARTGSRSPAPATSPAGGHRPRGSPARERRTAPRRRPRRPARSARCEASR